jgi:predicted nucleic acid-binding protein
VRSCTGTPARFEVTALRPIAADASPLIGLAAAGAFDLLRELYGTVTITRLVKDEITARADRPGAAELEAAMRSGWIRVAPTPLDTWAHAQLDPGEASTIALALQNERALVLMDDTRGREHAAALGLETIGVAGLLLAAKRAGLVDAVRPLLERLAHRGFTMPDDLLRGTLAEAGE